MTRPFTLHWHMAEGHIPFPQIRLVRRAYFTRDEADAVVRAWSEKKTMAENRK